MYILPSDFYCEDYAVYTFFMMNQIFSVISYSVSQMLSVQLEHSFKLNYVDAPYSVYIISEDFIGVWVATRKYLNAK